MKIRKINLFAAVFCFGAGVINIYWKQEGWAIADFAIAALNSLLIIESASL